MNGNIINFKDYNNKIKIPHVGWNECNLINKNELFYEVKNNSDFYFTHSYYLENCPDNNIISKTSYGAEFVSAVNKDNLYGVQFHPEKSQINGLKILKNFRNSSYTFLRFSA